jgi:hypothetical protein
VRFAEPSICPAGGFHSRPVLGELLDHVADQVGGQVVGERERRAGAGEQRERDVVLEHLAATLAPDRSQDVALVRQRDLARLDPLDLEVVDCDAPLE